MQKLELFAEPEQTFTVKEIAGILGVGTQTVRDWIKKHFPNKMQNGKTTNLTEKEITIIKQEMNQNKHLTNAREVTTDLEETMQILKGYELLMQKVKRQEEEIKQAKEKIQNDKPKVEFYENVGKAENLITVRQMAQLLGTGQNRLFAFLYAQKILKDRSTPYQPYVDKGYLYPREKEFQRNGKVFLDIRVWVSGKGQQYIHKLWKNKKKEQNALITQRN